MATHIRPLIAGNWKMNGTRDALTQIKAIAEGTKGSSSEKVDALLCPPSTLLYVATALCDDSPLMIGAQNCYHEQSGAYTGEISPAMIADCFGTHVIVGHSERRHYFNESDAMVSRKAQAAHQASLTSIICIGETADEQKQGLTLDVIKSQLDGSLPDNSNASNTVVSYEPVWAIGTGKTPSRNDIETTHGFIRQKLMEKFGSSGQSMRILYGGSVNAGNAGDILTISNVNGALIGGASLKAADFLAIYQSCAKIYREISDHTSHEGLE